MTETIPQPAQSWDPADYAEKAGFVAELGAPALDPWYFPTADEYRAKLESRGFTVSYIELIDRPTPLPGDIIGWLDVFAGSFFAFLTGAERADMCTEIAARLRPTMTDGNGQWIADYVRLRLEAHLPV